MPCSAFEDEKSDQKIIYPLQYKATLYRQNVLEKVTMTVCFALNIGKDIFQLVSM